MYSRYVPSHNDAQASPKPIRTNVPSQSPAQDADAPSTVGYSYSRYIPGGNAAPKPVQAAQVQYFDDEPNSPAPNRKRTFIEEDSEPVSPDSRKSKKTRNDGDDGSIDDTAAQPETGSKEKKKKKKRHGKKKQEEVETDDEDVESKREEEQHLEEDNDEEVEGENQQNEDASMIDMDEPEQAHQASPEPMDIASEKKPKREKRKKQKAVQEDEAEAEADEESQRHKTVLERKTKSLKLASEIAKDASDTDEEEPAELHGLEPLPQPAPAISTGAKPTYETLPPWLAAPVRVAQDTRMPFADLGILPKAARVLEEKGYRDAFAVQTAAVPLLLPTSKHQPGDVLISAATGSGKTLAYALPVVRDISQGVVTRLRALVVLPTRELVRQAQEAFELCAKAYEGGERKRARIGVSIGSQSLKSEQESLIERETRYDPEAYRRLSEEQQRKTGIFNTGGSILAGPEETDPRISTLEGHVVDFTPKVDVLICTPGRLVEHMEQTPGFSLDYVRWLVVDEADKLLAQSFQGWLDLVMDKLRINKFSARDFPDMDFSGVRKVILSATLTRDLSLLNQLALRRPKLIVLESSGDVQITEHSLPPLLKEHAVRVHDTNLKPLYLLELLQGQHMAVGSSANDETPTKPKVDDDADDSDTGSKGSFDSDASSNDSSDADSDTTSDDSSDSDSSSDTSSDLDSESESESDSESPRHSQRQPCNVPISLIFTKSNESALRLSRLLVLLNPSLESHINTLTSTTPTHIRRKTLRAFTIPSSPVRLIIASDLVARGIDIPNLDHVINYDLPPSVAGYVHRVGRTARAGRSGSAWTLVDDGESGWFWGKIAKGSGVRRSQKVERTRLEEMTEERVQEYEEALEKLGKEARR